MPAKKSFVVITDENRRVYGLTKQIVFAECAPGLTRSRSHTLQK